jgi:hypothetical protein
MARPYVVDGGDCYYMRMIAAIVLKKQPRTAEEGWSILRVGRELKVFTV